MRIPAVFLALVVASPAAHAVTSGESVPSSFGGNGHNASFDGRVFMVRDSQGWAVQILRPEAATYLPNGLPDAAGPLWSARTHILTSGDPATLVENALAICEDDPSRAPYSCDAAGSDSAAGPFDCYDFWLIDSDALTPADQGGALLRRRQLRLWVADPKTQAARVHDFSLSTSLEQLGPTLRGIEPTITADGKLMVWQGHPDNDGKIDILMYSVNPTACGASGWSAPRVVSGMATDPLVVGTYRLAERTLRAADGTVFSGGQLVHGAYPWLMPNGDAIVFQASPMPCRGPEDPPGCGPRRNSMAVVGYNTNWGIAIVDGGANPSADDTVRLFFSSPGPATFSQLPVTPGLDVWPMFGSNTSNYVELVFDDGLDGNYAGFWHFNENVTPAGDLDLTVVPDVSGYFNTGVLHGGLTVANRNNGVVGRALELDGVDDRVVVDHSITLNPINGITIAMYIRPAANPDCDGNNNYRLLLGKGDIGTGTYSVVVEEGAALQVRFHVDGEQRSIVAPALPIGQFTYVSCEYDGASGTAGCFYDDVQVASEDFGPGTLTPSSAPLTIGAPGPRAACPDGDGAFAGAIDELAISRFSRHFGQPPDPPDAGPSDGDGGSDNGNNSGTDGGTGPGPDGGCGCRTGGDRTGASSTAALLCLVLLLSRARRYDRRGQNT